MLIPAWGGFGRRTSRVEELRATTPDYASFWVQLEKIMEQPKEVSRFHDLYSFLYSTAQVFPDIIKFFVTQDETILSQSGIQDDMKYPSCLARENVDIIRLARYILARRYISADIGHFSPRDKYVDREYQRSLFLAHVSHPEREWYGYPIPNKLNLASAVRLLEENLIGESWKYSSKDKFLTGFRKWIITMVDVWVFIASCLKMDALNIAPFNTFEYSNDPRRERTFVDIVEDILRILDDLSPEMSKWIVCDGKPASVLIIEYRIRRQMQNCNIQDACIWFWTPPNPLEKWVHETLNKIFSWK